MVLTVSSNPGGQSTAEESDELWHDSVRQVSLDYELHDLLSIAPPTQTIIVDNINYYTLYLLYK